MSFGVADCCVGFLVSALSQIFISKNDVRPRVMEFRSCLQVFHNDQS